MQRKTCLIVDDSRAMRTILLRTLRQAGYGHHTFIEAASGAEALRVIEGGPLDLILCDWNMPEMTGIDLLKELDRRRINVPFVFVATDHPEFRQVAKFWGARAYVSKPFTTLTMEEALAPILGPGEVR